jgi:hypothetical protein
MIGITKVLWVSWMGHGPMRRQEYRGIVIGVSRHGQRGGAKVTDKKFIVSLQHVSGTNKCVSINVQLTHKNRNFAI